MNKILKNVYYSTKNFSTSISNKINNNCVEIMSKTKKKTDMKSEEEIQKIISDKIKEYHELLSCQSLECEELCSEMKTLESKLRKAYGFHENENLTNFPVFKFDEPKIDNPLD